MRRWFALLIGIEDSVLWRFVLFFIGFPVLELFILFLMMNGLGPFGIILTVLLIVGASILGVGLLRYQGLSCWFEIHRQLDRGELPTQPIADGVLILMAGVLLITPVLLTDLLGLLLLFPPIRRMVFGYTLYRFEVHRMKTRQRPTTPVPDEVIDI